MKKTIMEEAQTIFQQARELNKMVGGNDNYLNETGAQNLAEEEEYDPGSEMDDHYADYANQEVAAINAR